MNAMFPLLKQERCQFVVFAKFAVTPPQPKEKTQEITAIITS